MREIRGVRKEPLAAELDDEIASAFDLSGAQTRSSLFRMMPGPILIGPDGKPHVTLRTGKTTILQAEFGGLQKSSLVVFSFWTENRGGHIRWSRESAWHFYLTGRHNVLWSWSQEVRCAGFQRSWHAHAFSVPGEILNLVDTAVWMVPSRAAGR